MHADRPLQNRSWLYMVGLCVCAEQRGWGGGGGGSLIRHSRRLCSNHVEYSSHYHDICGSSYSVALLCTGILRVALAADSVARQLLAPLSLPRYFSLSSLLSISYR